MKKIGIMGGTFNPIHNAHLMMAQAAYEQYELDEVWFMPSGNPPHKQKTNIASGHHRKRMVQHAIDEIPHFIFSDLELQREGLTYTCDTLEFLHSQRPELQIYFILGGDSLQGFHDWYQPEKIVNLCTVLATSREGVSDPETEALCRELSRRLQGTILPVRMPQFRISSAMIRERLANGQAADGLCPEKVVRYIELHGLYGTVMANKPCRDKELLACLSATLRPKRYRHTLGVAYTAANLAVCHGVDSKRARLAGLLHDCAKYYTDEEMYILCEENGLHLNPAEQKNPALVHSKLGACLAHDRFGVNDEEVCSAISYHTTGRPGMTALEKIIYLADYIEPYRKMDCRPYSLDEIRRTCFHDLNKGLQMTLRNTVSYLESSGMTMDPVTMETYQYYQNTSGKGISL